MSCPASMPRAKPKVLISIQQASLGQRPRCLGAGHQVMAVFCFNLIAREAGAEAGTKQQAHHLPDQVPNSESSDRAAAGQNVSDSPASQVRARFPCAITRAKLLQSRQHSRVPTRPAFLGTF